MGTAEQRANAVLGAARYLALATVDDDGAPWACNLAYVIEGTDSLALIYYSDRASAHSRHVAARPTVSGTAYVLEPELDGVQFRATITEVGDDLAAVHEHYYATFFPNAEERAVWELPVEAFTGEHPHRFYRITITELWVINAEDWESDKVDRRIAVDLRAGQ